MSEAQQDDFKWFGEGFEGFPKRLPEDCVEYAIHIINDKLTDTHVREALGRIERAANDLASKLLKEYIWQRETFHLKLERENNSWVLRGQTNYGDSVDDEWLIVYLLRESSKISTDAWIRVYDTGGEFLLIEAANALPRWLNPEVAQNRVWIHDGKLLVVPLHQSLTPQEKTNPITKPLTIEEALLFIQTNPSRLSHSPLIQEEAFYRIRNYPMAITKTLHHSIVRIPRNLAYILHHHPTYISGAIEAFYLRDPISLRPLNSTDASNLKFPPNDRVDALVRFTKVGYAQLHGQNFAPPKPWEHVFLELKDDQETKRTEIGMKLACGFEMQIADPQNQDKRSIREIRLILDDLESGEESLPSDAEVSQWPMKEDDESWLDIDFNEFERELAGKKGVVEGGPAGGFGDKGTQENLRKMVERFEDFLNADDADDMDEDDDSTSNEEEDEGEDKEVSFDEDEFVRMMREMMGVPPEENQPMGTSKDEIAKAIAQLADLKPELGDDGSDDDEEEIRQLSNLMEAELNATGALSRNPAVPSTSTRKSPKGSSADTTKNGKEKQRVVELSDDEDEGEDASDDEVDIDFNLAHNLLQSLKGQAGMAGPVGNLMGTMDLKAVDGGDKTTK